MFKMLMPADVYFGCGAIHKLGALCKDLGKKPLLVIDPFFIGKDIRQNILAQLEKNGQRTVEFCKIVSNPHSADIDEGLALCKSEGCDFVIALGGGSTMDTAKTIALAMTNGGKSWDYCGQKLQDSPVKKFGVKIVPTKRALPIVAIATTAGTGSETTPFAVINNTAEKKKSGILHRFIFADISIVDPELMVSMPPLLTAQTGLDVLSHAVEAYTAVGATPYSDVMCLESIRLFAESFEAAVANGSNIKAREKMALASSYAGVAIGQACTSLPHALGLPLSAIYDANHGGSLGACLPEIIKWTLPVCEDRFARVAEILDKSVCEKTVSEQAAALPDIINGYMERANLDVTFGGYGMLTDEQATEVADYVYEYLQGDCKNYPKYAEYEDLLYLVKACR